MAFQKNDSGTGKPADRDDIPNVRKHIPEKDIRTVTPPPPPPPPVTREEGK